MDINFTYNLNMAHRVCSFVGGVHGGGPAAQAANHQAHGALWGEQLVLADGQAGGPKQPQRHLEQAVRVSPDPQTHCQ